MASVTTAQNNKTIIWMPWNDKSVTYSCMPNCFYFVLWAKLPGRSVQNYEKWSFFSVFSRLGSFPWVFGQVKEWPIFELYETIRVPHIVARPFVFILSYERSCQGRVFKIMKNDHFLVFLSVWVLFPDFLGRWRSDLY